MLKSIRPPQQLPIRLKPRNKSSHLFTSSYRWTTPAHTKHHPPCLPRFYRRNSTLRNVLIARSIIRDLFIYLMGILISYMVQLPLFSSFLLHEQTQFLSQSSIHFSLVIPKISLFCRLPAVDTLERFLSTCSCLVSGRMCYVGYRFQFEVEFHGWVQVSWLGILARSSGKVFCIVLNRVCAHIRRLSCCAPL